jgi:hypothetical protein
MRHGVDAIRSDFEVEDRVISVFFHGLDRVTDVGQTPPELLVREAAQVDVFVEPLA